MTVLEAQMMLRGLDKMNLIGGDMVEVFECPVFYVSLFVIYCAALYLCLCNFVVALAFKIVVVVQVAPPYDPSGNTAMVGAQIMFEIACVLKKSFQSRR